MALGEEESDEARERQRLAYLEAMGVQAWGLRIPLPEAPPETRSAERIDSRELAPETDARNATETLATVADPSSDRRESPDFSSSEPPEPRAAVPSASPPDERETAACAWETLQAEVAACVACPLHRTRTQTVFGVGDRTAKWMVVGEAPGEQEDLQGEPFVGRAGLLLNEMLRAIGLLREQVYIANVLKCRPPKNRDPQPDEAAACEGHLLRQLALVQPKIILAVGRIAAQNLLKTAAPIGKLRGAVHDYRGVPLVVVYHPAYLLRSPLEKRRAWDDLRLALQVSRRDL